MSPRVYRFKPGWVALFLLMGMGCLGMAIFTARVAVSSSPDASWIVPLFLAGLGVFALAALRARVELDDHWIAAHSGFSMRRIDRGSVVGRRIRQHRNVSVLHLLTDAPGVKPLQIPLLFRFDAEFDEWVRTLRDLDLEEKFEIAESLFASHDDRSIARARFISRALTSFAFLCSSWVAFLPRPYHAAIVANIVLPLIAIALLALGRGLYSCDEKPNDPRPTVAYALILPGFGLLWRLVNDVSMLQPWQLIAPGVVIAVILGAAAVRFDPRASRWSRLVLPLLLFAHSASAVAWANCTFDRSEPHVYEARVEKKSVERDKTTTYTLQLGPWGPRAKSDSVDVSEEVYESAQEGKDVRVVLRDGRFRMPWFYVVP